MDHNHTTLPTEAEIEREATYPCAWPKSILRIAKVERPMFFRMATMFFLIAFVYSILRDTKDAVVLNKQEPSSISILKSFYVTPASIAFVFIIQKLQTKYTVSTILKYITLAFGMYFVLYSTVLLKLSDFIGPSPIWSDSIFADGKMSYRGLQFGLAIAKTFNFWAGSLLYISAELWGNIVLSLLFLNYSNEVCTPKQNGRFVPLFYIFSNFGLFFSGLSMLTFSYIQDKCSFKINRFILNAIVFAMGIISFIISFIHWRLEKNVLSTPFFIPERGIQKKKKKKVGFLEGFIYMTKSYLLLNICFIVIAYNITANFVDSVFKGTMKAYAKEFNLEVTSSVMQTQAISQIIISLLVIVLLCTPFARLTQIIGWRLTGLITPTFGVIGGLFIFALAALNTGISKTNKWNFIINRCSIFTSTFIEWEKQIGRLATAGLKVFKYAAFDIAKEAISVRINPIDRPMFKGIYDGICGKLGKSSGSIFITFLSAQSNTTDARDNAQILFIISVCLGCLWFYSVKYLGNKYNDSIEANADIDLDMIKVGKKDIEI